ncbi:unnamed protein product [Durusdinium trenchii]|uniref:Uncharacterized protein n=1 Tax=Durusdinium trenchii TaxID=1381693 RepID=A0ABP0K6S2_9DINO
MIYDDLRSSMFPIASVVRMVHFSSIPISADVTRFSEVVTNQVMGDPTSGAARVTLGHVWHHSVNWRLVLSHLPPGPGGPGSKEQADPFGRRYLLVEKSPCCETLTIPFSITEHGLNELKPQ